MSRFVILLPSECIIFVLLSLCFVVLFYSHWGLGLLFCSICVSFSILLPLGLGFVIVLIVCRFVILLPLEFAFDIWLSLCVLLLSYSNLNVSLLSCSHCVSFCYFTPIGVQV